MGPSLSSLEIEHANCRGVTGLLINLYWNLINSYQYQEEACVQESIMAEDDVYLL